MTDRFASGLSGHERGQSYRLERLGGSAEPRVDTAWETQKRAHLPSDADLSYPNGFLQSLLIIALYSAMFLVALDMSIVATAIPTITVEFNSVDQVGWYGSAFFMMLAAFQAFWGKGYKLFNLKAVFLSSIFVFEVGSLIIAAAQNSRTVIVGRAVQGAGGAGVTAGCYTICAYIVRPKWLPTLMGSFGIMWSCASVVGPLLGGVFTQDVSWRWCFWINLPVGSTTFLIILVFFSTPKHAVPANGAAKRRWHAFDFPGMVLLVGALICFCLALQNGGLTTAWNSNTSIGLLFGFGTMTIAFAIIEWRQGERAMLVGRIVKNRSIAVCSAYGFFTNAGQFARTYNLPIYFQAARGISPVGSGLRTLPTVLSMSISALVSSVAIGKVGYYQPFLLFGAVLGTIGSAMIYTLQISSPAAHYIGYQVIAGIGVGAAIQVPLIVAQGISSRTDMAVAVSSILFSQFIGGTIGVSTSQAIMNNRMVAQLPPPLGARVLEAGATGLRQAFPNPQILQEVLNAYMIGLKNAWIFSIAMGCMTFVVASAAEWKSIRASSVEARNTGSAAIQRATEESSQQALQRRLKDIGMPWLGPAWL